MPIDLTYELTPRTEQGAVDCSACASCIRKAAERLGGAVTIETAGSSTDADTQTQTRTQTPSQTQTLRVRLTCLDESTTEAQARRIFQPWVDACCTKDGGTTDADHGAADHSAQAITIDSRAIATTPKAADSKRHTKHADESAAPWWLTREVIAVVAGGFCLVASWWAHHSMGDASSVAGWISPTLAGLSAVLTSLRTFPRAIGALRDRELGVDTLMFVAAAGAWLLGHQLEAAFLLFLFGLGAAGENLALGRAQSAIHALSSVAPETARRVAQDGTETEVPVGELAIGDAVIVGPYERIPIDGEITEGTTEIDQATITGESVPVARTVGDGVFAGTVNTTHQIRLRATRAATDTMISRIVSLVEDAQANRSPVQQFTDRVEAIYVPWVLVITALLAIVPPLMGWRFGAPSDPTLGTENPWALWFYRSMSFLTAASPCALAIGTPAAVLCTIARAARMGVIFKGGGHVATLAKAQSFCFDKTGTLTLGQPKVQRVLVADGIDPADLRRWAAAVEVGVNHPLADAIVRDAAQQNAFPATNPKAARADSIQQIAGRGAQGVVDGHTIAVGRPEASSTHANDATDDVMAKAIDAWRDEGLTLAVVTRDGVTVGLYGIADEVRTESADVLASLQQAGIAHLEMLTGDHPAAAQRIADAVGLPAIAAGLAPEEKLQRIAELKRQHGPVVMIGDGVNDAPALAAADLGIAVGAAEPSNVSDPGARDEPINENDRSISPGGAGGSDVAIETADIVLMSNGLARVPDAVHLARRSQRIIRQNLIVALGVISLVAPAGALGYADLGTAVVLHEGSTVLVVLNALRLLRAGATRP